MAVVIAILRPFGIDGDGLAIGPLLNTSRADFQRQWSVVGPNLDDDLEPLGRVLDRRPGQQRDLDDRAGLDHPDG